MPHALPNGTKTCTKCKEHKQVCDFNVQSRQGDGLAPACRRCMYAYNAEYRTSEQGLTTKRGYGLKAKFGMPLDEYNALFQEQSGCCAICAIHQSQCKKALAVDHCHETGHIRGLLCINCNLGLGNFQDKTAFLSKAIKYLNPEDN